MRLTQLLLRVTIGISAALLGLLVLSILWIAAGGLVQSVEDHLSLAAAILQAVALLGALLLAARGAASRRWWGVCLLAETLATGLSAAIGVSWRAPGPEVLMAFMPLICAAGLWVLWWLDAKQE